MAKDKNVTGEEILDICSAYMSADDLKLVEKAWHYATDAHSGQSRQSGEPYIIHPIQVAGILADLHLDAVTVACGSYTMSLKTPKKRLMIWKRILVRMYEISWTVLLNLVRLSTSPMRSSWLKITVRCLWPCLKIFV